MRVYVKKMLYIERKFKVGKIADKYIKIDKWKIIEDGFNAYNGMVSESIFSLGNEYMGVRGYFDEGYSGEKLIGSYLNGIIEKDEIKLSNSYKGMVKNKTYMVNTVDWLYTRISIDGEELDLSRSNIREFKRILDMKQGILTREFIWDTSKGKSIKITFERFVSMVESKLGCQKIVFEPLNFSGNIEVESGLDFSRWHQAEKKNLWACPKKGKEKNIIAILGETLKSKQKVLSAFELKGVPEEIVRYFMEEKFVGVKFSLFLDKSKKRRLEKIVVNYAEKNISKTIEEVWKDGMAVAKKLCSIEYEKAFGQQRDYWESVWKSSDIVIEGDEENQQGIRYCIFQLYQTYHGEDSRFNIGAKGLTGEAYSGNTFWDTETYCLPFYIFNNPRAAKNLIEFRYKTLPEARKRAAELDCEGAFYPIATNDGSETCGLWQHASLQLQASTGVAYAIWHYDKLIEDKKFLYTKGIEMLIEISRMLASRGQWGQKNNKFGYFAVMGPDEFQMMVNNNFYTNIMGKKTLAYTLEVLIEMTLKAPQQLNEIEKKLKLCSQELEDWKLKEENMYIPYDEKTGIYEQHDGYFDLPHINIHSIPVEQFPLYHSWSYDRIYRNDMIKQPDVLMYMFLHNQEFSFETKKINYEYYEPRTIHESSLSPSIHSILASELKKYGEAFEFFKFATRMDLDNYNRNTNEGLHTTSIAAAWMNIVYGFGGMRSDGKILAFKPSIPDTWKSYSFNLLYKGTLLHFKIDNKFVTVYRINGPVVKVNIYDENYLLDSNEVKIALQ